jgi:oligoribonuclease NrnB/cAMP/cGMP phosphodiesterase (DHH superfamily)
MKCLYHRGDLDGKCSAAIVAMHEPGCELIGLDYQDEVDLKALGIAQGERVVMVDFSLEPVSRMLELHAWADLVWIDHHRSAIDAVAAAGVVIPGLQEVGTAACELTWRWFGAGEELPLAVHLLGRYDVWDHFNPDVMPFQYGMRARGAWDPFTDFAAWCLLMCDDAYWYVREIIREGQTVLAYEQEVSARYARDFAWRGRIYTGDLREAPLLAIFLNRGLASSKDFRAFDDGASMADVFAAYVQLPDGRFKVSLYRPEHWRQGIGRCDDVGALAETFGGGGHAGAAGFVTGAFPFVPGGGDGDKSAANGAAGLDEIAKTGGDCGC